MRSVEEYGHSPFGRHAYDRRGENSVQELEGMRERNQSSIGDLLANVVSGEMRARMSAAQRAAAAWYGANGDIERAHTTGVFLKKPKRAGVAPVLGVYVDSHARLTDFTVNREIYLARLHNAGLEVSGIEFFLTRRDRTSSAEGRTADERSEARQSLPQREKPLDLPELDPARRAEIGAAVADLDEPLRSKVAHAMELSMRRQELGVEEASSDASGKDDATEADRAGDPND